VRWTELSPPEWRERDQLTRAELHSTGIVQPFEKEYFRKDGSRVPVLVGVASFKEGSDQGLAFVLDLSERKRAEEALRESEQNLRSAIDGIPGLVGMLAPNGEHEAVNRHATVGQWLCRMLSWPVWVSAPTRRLAPYVSSRGKAYYPSDTEPAKH